MAEATSAQTTVVDEEEEKERLAREKAVKERAVQAIKLNQARIREQIERCSNERYRQMLEQELSHLDAQLKATEA